MSELVQFANSTLDNYNSVKKRFDVSPTEYLVWLALIKACSKAATIPNQSYVVSANALLDEVLSSRETVRRSLYQLQEKGLAKKIGDNWLFTQPD